MRWIVRLAAMVLIATLAVVLLGPMFPAGSFIGDWSRGLREALNAWWGFPLGLPS
jgi:hypothetical protein